MGDEDGNRPVPALDFDLMRAVAPVGREHGLRETAAAMLRWSVVIMRVLEGEHDTAEQLRALSEECAAAHRADGRAEEARRRKGIEHG